MEEMTTNDQDLLNIEHCNNISIDIRDFRPKFNLNPLATEFIYLGQGLDLNVTQLNKDNYYPGTIEYLLYLGENIK
jgi:hypothetical protein